MTRNFRIALKIQKKASKRCDAAVVEMLEVHRELVAAIAAVGILRYKDSLRSKREQKDKL